MAEIVHLDKGVIKTPYEKIMERAGAILRCKIGINTVPRPVVSFDQDTSRRGSGVDRKIADLGMVRREKGEDGR
jgi:hypothetical protein